MDSYYEVDTIIFSKKFKLKRRSSSKQKDDRKMIFPKYLRNLQDILRTEEYNLLVLKKSNKMIFSLAWNTKFIEY